MSANWNRSNDVVWEELDNRAVLVNPASGARWSLNATAAAIWKLCDGSRSMGELAADLAKVSGRCERMLAAEITAFCDAFARMGLLHTSAERKLAGASGICFSSGLDLPPAFQPLGAGGGSRRRPTPHGVSGPV